MALEAVDILAANPAATDRGAVVRNIPSGTQTVSGTVTANQGAAGVAAWPVTGTVAYGDVAATTETHGSVAAAVADTAIIAANANRLGASVFNDSGSAYCYLLLGAGPASNTAFTIKLPPYGYYEVPLRWKGQVRAYWDLASGNARWQELTA